MKTTATAMASLVDGHWRSHIERSHVTKFRGSVVGLRARAFFAEAARADYGAMVVQHAGLPRRVELAVLDGFERYDGHGTPCGKARKPRRTVDDDGLDILLRGLADIADLKSPWFSEHTSGVAEFPRETSRNVAGEGAARFA